MGSPPWRTFTTPPFSPHYGLMEPLPVPSCTVNDVIHFFGSCPSLQLDEPSRPCFTPGKDFVIPHPAFEQPVNHPNLVAEPMYNPGPNREPVFQEGPKKHDFFFAGGISKDDIHAFYTRGVRQTVRLLRNSSGIHFVTTPYDARDYIETTQQSTFCLVTSGNSFGDRLKVAVLNGCIPFVIEDNVQVDWEDLLPYRDFAIRIPHRLIWQLPTILKQLMADTNRIKDMQSKIERCVWQFFMWEPPGNAMEALICELKRKMFPDLKPELDWGTCKLRCELPRGPLPA
eukprot:jgi/Botrbrau1/9035/Bobra.0376s0012.1